MLAKESHLGNFALEWADGEPQEKPREGPTRKGNMDKPEEEFINISSVHRVRDKAMKQDC